MVHALHYPYSKHSREKETRGGAAMTAILTKGSIVRCSKCDDLQKPFLGKILDHLTHHVIVQIINFDPVDRYMVAVLDGQVTLTTDQVRPLRMIKIDGRTDQTSRG